MGRRRKPLDLSAFMASKPEPDWHAGMDAAAHPASPANLLLELRQDLAEKLAAVPGVRQVTYDSTLDEFILDYASGDQHRITTDMLLTHPQLDPERFELDAPVDTALLDELERAFDDE